jgi:hypothetical protein
MLPNPHHLPAILAKLATNSTISIHIFETLVLPERDVGFRLSIAFLATMPEAAIDENRDFLLVKCKIRTSRKRRMPPPSVYLLTTQQRDDLLLGALVSSTSHQ